MSTYVVGDIQGCADAFERLLDRIGLASDDALWLAGDLVNRGPDNLEVLRRARELRAKAVLGNHDLHLLGRARGTRPGRRNDTLRDVLHAPDRDELVDWLSRLPFVHRDGDRVMVHAGFMPDWSWRDVELRAERASRVLANRTDELLAQISRDPPPADDELRAAADDISVFTRIRMLDAEGQPDGRFTGRPEDAPSQLTPWYQVSKLDPELTVYFGHWAALGYRALGRFVALDSGCVWGNALTAVRAEDGAVFSVPAHRRD
jgi:bis(5'-nucleosyl)-tetraphosphatase (symmetrical)